MPVDASRLKRRRSLGTPPTEGAPGIEEETVPEAGKPLPQLPAPSTKRAAEVRDQEVAPDPVAAPLQPDPAEPNGTGEGIPAAEPEVPDEDPEDEPTPARRTDIPVARGRGADAATLVQRQRVPLPIAEPRVPFTTRVTLSTKERLENACYHLRRKHQDFINDAILAHLKKHGF